MGLISDFLDIKDIFGSLHCLFHFRARIFSSSSIPCLLIAFNSETGMKIFLSSSKSTSFASKIVPPSFIKCCAIKLLETGFVFAEMTLSLLIVILFSPSSIKSPRGSPILALNDIFIGILFICPVSSDAMSLLSNVLKTTSSSETSISRGILIREPEACFFGHFVANIYIPDSDPCFPVPYPYSIPDSQRGL